jgi:hypothetical protein
MGCEVIESVYVTCHKSKVVENDCLCSCAYACHILVAINNSNSLQSHDSHSLFETSIIVRFLLNNLKIINFEFDCKIQKYII